MEERMIDDEYGRGVRLKKTKDGYVDVTDELAEKGEKAASIIAEKSDRILAAASAGVSDSDREIMYRCLATICDNLQRICDEYAE